MKCYLCEKELSDWQGNVMIRNEEYPHAHDICLICKPCTQIIDNYDALMKKKRQLHNVWELYWFVKDHEYMCENFQEDRKKGRFGEPAIKKIQQLIDESKQFNYEN